MNIYEKDGRVYLELKDLKNNRMLFSFSVEKEAYNELSDHIIEHLLAFESKEKKKKDDSHQSIADMMLDDALERGDF